MTTKEVAKEGVTSVHKAYTARAPGEHTLRRAAPEDVEACANILNDWIDARDWMPRVHTPDDVLRFYRDFVFQKRTVWVIGDPVLGFMACDETANMVTALYVARTGAGLGK
ncbi:MAG: hypothetical protein AAGA05_02605, partial [Pseudomonadota bacterium]